MPWQPLLEVTESTEDPEKLFSEHDMRHSYRTSFAYCLERNPYIGKEEIPEPFVIIHDLYRIMGSEWVAVNTYVERELGTIDFRLEKEHPVKTEVLEEFLYKLFFLRRRVALYEKLVKEQLHSCKMKGREKWRLPSTADINQKGGSGFIDEVSSALESDFGHLYELFCRNSERITQMSSVLMALISVRESQATIAQSQSLGLLTVVATVFLPFNTVATVMNIGGELSPTGAKSWIFWVSSSIICICLLVVYVGYRSVDAFNRGKQYRSVWGSGNV